MPAQPAVRRPFFSTKTTFLTFCEIVTCLIFVIDLFPFYHRSLQKIVIQYQDGWDLEDVDKKTESESVSDRKNIDCRSLEYEDIASYKTEVQFMYTGETDIDVAAAVDEDGDGQGEDVDGDKGSAEEDCHLEEIPDVVAQHALELLANAFCNDQESEGEGGDIFDNANLANCVLSISLGAPGYNTGTCSKQLEESTTCNVFSDQLTIWHTDACASNEVAAAADSVLKTKLPSDEFRDDLNADCQCTDPVSPYVTLIGWFVDDSGSATAAQTMIDTNTGGLTAAAKFMIFLAVAATLLLILLGFAWKKHRDNRRRRLEDDLKSIRTDWSNPTNDDNSYLQPDFHDLALRHSKQNVHRCNSAFCRTCRPNLGLVHMMPVPKEKPTKTRKKLDEICCKSDEPPQDDLCMTVGCMGEDDVPGQVVYPNKNKGKAKDPLEVQASGDPVDLNKSYQSDLTEDEMSPPAFVAGRRTKKQKKNKSQPVVDEQRPMSPLEYDEVDYSYCDNEDSNDGFTFVRIANAKPAVRQSSHNCDGQPCQEVVL